MCMLTFYSDGVQPDSIALRNGAEMNNDGHGFAIVTRDARNPIVRRFMDSEVAIAEFTRLREQFSDGPALFHSRWGTGGEVTTRNAHPFRIDNRTVIAHNGVLPKALQPDKDDWRCDTRMFAEDKLRGEDLSNTKVRNSIAHRIGAGNKLVILSTRPDYAPSYIVNEDAGHWVDDTWYSNLDFTGYWNSGTHTVVGSVYAPDNSFFDCRFCESIDVDFETGVCMTCDLCQDCASDFWKDCVCYIAHREYTTYRGGTP